MSVSGNRISPPVTIEDLMALVWVRLKRTVNGVEQTILSSDLGVLCGAKIGDTVPAHDNLGSWTVIDRVYPNKWARYHPMRYNTIPYITHAKRKEYHFGLDVPFCNAYAAIGWHACCMNTMVFDIIYGETYVGWEYLMPRGDRTPQGGIKEYYRLLDFVRIPTDDTDPFYGTQTTRGYNHKAPIPFGAYMSAGGITIRDDGVYQINKQGSTKIILNFYNNTGDDLHLQDLINLSENTGSGDNDNAWRPVLQVFDDYTPAGGDEWYDRDNPDVEIAGDVITSEQGAIWQVELDVTNFENNYNHLYHLCVGVGFCKKTLNSSGNIVWGKSTDALFIMPYTEDQLQNNEQCFYYKFAVVNYFDRSLNFYQMRFGGSPTTTYTIDAYTFNVPSSASGTLTFSMTINNREDQPLHFVGENGTAASGYTSLKILLENQLTGDWYYLTPASGLNWQTSNSQYIVGSSGTTTIYGYTTQIDLSNLNRGESYRFQVLAYIGNADAENANAFSIHKAN